MLSEKEAYCAMFYYLDFYYQRGPSLEIGGMLGSMSFLQDGLPADRGVWQDWLKAVEKAKEVGASEAMLVLTKKK